MFAANHTIVDWGPMVCGYLIAQMILTTLSEIWKVTDTRMEYYHDIGLLGWLDLGLAPSHPRILLNKQWAWTRGHLESCCEHQNFGTWTGHFTETCHGHSNYFFRYNWSYFIQACVPLPFVIVIGNLQFNKTLHSVTCINCKLYTCLNSSISLSYSILCYSCSIQS